jgi:hypothetical protein
MDNATWSGWSVTVTGRAALVADPGMSAWYRAVPLVPWAPGPRDTFLTITTKLAEGRRVRRPPAKDGHPKGTRIRSTGWRRGSSGPS